MQRRWERLIPMAMICALLVATGCAMQRDSGPMQTAETPLIAEGRALFNDVKLSGDGKWSCASCHPNNGHTNNKTYVGVAW